jgi:DNA-binding NtrC family response regulator
MSDLVAATLPRSTGGRTAVRQAHVLIIEDDPVFGKYLTVALGDARKEITLVATAREALQKLQGRLFDVVILDLRLPDARGTSLLRQIRAYDQRLEIVVLTGHPDVETAVQALKEGAYDYLTKPVERERLLRVIDRVIDNRMLRDEVRALRSQLAARLTQQEIVATSPAMLRVKELIAQVAPNGSNVVIDGETGTGKERVAAAIHNLSPRRDRPFVPVNCAAIPRELLESEFFGHVRGAFSGAIADQPGLFRSADGGTLFLDEVTELPPALQAKLLRVLQERQVRPVGSGKSYDVDVRIVAASSQPLDAAVRDGGIRQDFYYRLSVVNIRIPPLRERREDIPALTAHFLRQLNERFGRDLTGLSPAAMSALTAYDFPGNVRELEHLLERACALGARHEITLEDLPPLANGADCHGCSRIQQLADTERQAIVQALTVHGKDRDAAARSLGMSRRTLYRRLREFGLLGATH